MERFIFDVDGTLTPSRGKMDPEFKSWFIDFIKHNKVWLVTGSDYPKTLEQLGPEICENVVTCYNCQGNDVWFQGSRVNFKAFDPPADLITLMNGWLFASKFPIRTGQHIEKRKGMINFSIVGRGATQCERREYVLWDSANRERESIAYEINSKFEGITATVGGETGLDIHRTGSDKSQILEDFSKSDKIHFYGDKMEPGGNDYPLAKALKKYQLGFSHPVENWKHTFNKLKSLKVKKDES